MVWQKQLIFASPGALKPNIQLSNKMSLLTLIKVKQVSDIKTVSVLVTIVSIYTLVCLVERISILKCYHFIFHWAHLFQKTWITYLLAVKISARPILQTGATVCIRQNGI